MSEDKKNSNSLDQTFQDAIDRANQLDVDEPPLVWPELPEDLRIDPPRKEAPEK
ncbi:MAG: hypothetical protein KFF46_02325 [Desulfobacterales bacterium]|nr:hypothetical protein [Desulfobacterales bacterium]